MPKFRSNTYISNLSISLPRRVHRLVKARAIRSGAPSLAAYVATVLEQAPDRMTEQQRLQAMSIELLLTIHGGTSR